MRSPRRSVTTLLRLAAWLLPALALVAILDPFPASPSNAQEDVDFVIIVHADNSTGPLESSWLSKVFLKKVKRWPDAGGLSILPVDQNEKSTVREVFTRRIHNKKVSAIKSYWQRMIFSGRDVPPAELDSDQSVLDFVRSEPGAIGYVWSDTELGDGVRRVEVTE